MKRLRKEAKIKERKEKNKVKKKAKIKERKIKERKEKDKGKKDKESGRGIPATLLQAKRLGNKKSKKFKMVVRVHIYVVSQARNSLCGLRLRRAAKMKRHPGGK